LSAFQRENYRRGGVRITRFASAAGESARHKSLSMFLSALLYGIDATAAPKELLITQGDKANLLGASTGQHAGKF